MCQTEKPVRLLHCPSEMDRGIRLEMSLMIGLVEGLDVMISKN